MNDDHLMKKQMKSKEENERRLTSMKCSIWYEIYLTIFLYHYPCALVRALNSFHLNDIYVQWIINTEWINIYADFISSVYTFFLFPSNVITNIIFSDKINPFNHSTIAEELIFKTSRIVSLRNYHFLETRLTKQNFSMYDFQWFLVVFDECWFWLFLVNLNLIFKWNIFISSPNNLNNEQSKTV